MLIKIGLLNLLHHKVNAFDGLNIIFFIKQNQMKNIEIYKLFLMLVLVCASTQNLASQKSKSFNANIKVFKKLANTLKINPTFRIDTMEKGFGQYEKIISPFFDKVLLQKRIKEADNPLEMTENVAFMFQQSNIATLQTYLKKIPAKYLQIIPESLSKSIDNNWRSNSNEQEISDIENSLLLVFKNESKQINLIKLRFNPKTNKVIYLNNFGYLNGEHEYLMRIMERN